MDFIKLGSTREVNLDHVEYILEDEDKTGFTLHLLAVTRFTLNPTITRL